MNAFCINLRSAIAALVTTAFYLCSGNVLHAGEDGLAYTLTAIEDLNYGEQIIAGEYETAIEGILSSSKIRRNAFEAQTNLCVAFTRTGDFDRAGTSCDSALEALGDRRLSATYSRRTQEKYLALALSNRGVLHAVSGEPELARRDFTRAAKLRFDLNVVDINLARLGSTRSKDASAQSAVQDM